MSDTTKSIAYAAYKAYNETNGTPYAEFDSFTLEAFPAWYNVAEAVGQWYSAGNAESQAA